jgi:hypothetical protein
MSSKSIKAYENFLAEQGRPVPKPIDIRPRLPVRFTIKGLPRPTGAAHIESKR